MKGTHLGPMTSCACPFVAVIKWVMNSVLNTQDRTGSPSSDSGPLRTYKKVTTVVLDRNKTYHPVISKVRHGNGGNNR